MGRQAGRGEKPIPWSMRHNSASCWARRASRMGTNSISANPRSSNLCISLGWWETIIVRFHTGPQSSFPARQGRQPRTASFCRCAAYLMRAPINEDELPMQLLPGDIEVQARPVFALALGKARHSVRGARDATPAPHARRSYVQPRLWRGRALGRQGRRLGRWCWCGHIRRSWRGSRPFWIRSREPAPCPGKRDRRPTFTQLKCTRSALLRKEP